MAKIIDEIQTPNTRNKRLLILDEDLWLKSGNSVKIGNSVYKSLTVYDMKHSIAIICDPSTGSLVGKTITENFEY